MTRLRQLPLTAHLEVDDNQKDGNRGQQVGAVGQIVPVESLFQSSYFVATLYQQLEESNDSSFKLGTLGACDGVRAECLPDDVLANVGSNEQGDARPQPISFLEHFIQANDNDASKEQLQAHRLVTLRTENQGKLKKAEL